MHGIAFFVVSILIALAAGYAIRGFIRREISVARADALDLAARLEAAAAVGGTLLENEARNVAVTIRNIIARAAGEL